MVRTLFIGALLLSSGCMPFRRAKAPPPPPGPIPVRIPDQVSTAEPPPSFRTLPPPPAIETPTPDGRPTATTAVGLPSLPEAPTRRRVRPRVAVRRPALPDPVSPSAESATAEPAEPTYRLGELRTPRERDLLRRETEQLLDHCGVVLATIEGRTLTPMQSEMLNRVRTFAQQARETLDKDPGEARNYAAKGRTFADALLMELR